MRQVMVKGTEPTYWVPAATSRGILKDKAEYSAFNAVCRRLREDVTDLRTDGRTDRPSYRDARTHLITRCSK